MRKNETVDGAVVNVTGRNAPVNASTCENEAYMAMAMQNRKKFLNILVESGEFVGTLKNDCLRYIMKVVESCRTILM